MIKLVEIDHEYWNKPYKNIQDFDDFINIIINWDDIYDQYEQYNVYGMIDIFCCCLEYMKKNYDEDEINRTIGLLKPKELNFFLEMVHEIENYKLSCSEEDMTTSSVNNTKRNYTPIDPNNPFGSISNYDDFTGLIVNWETIIKDDGEFKLNGMIEIFEACLKHINRVFFDFDLEQLSEALYQDDFNFLLRLRKVAKQKFPIE